MIHDPARIDALAIEIQAFGAESHRMRFVLVRNAVGPPPTGSSGGLLGGLL